MSKKAAPFTFRKKTPKKRRQREESEQTNVSVKKQKIEHVSVVDTKVPSRAPPKPMDTPGIERPPPSRLIKAKPIEMKTDEPKSTVILPSRAPPPPPVEEESETLPLPRTVKENSQPNGTPYEILIQDTLVHHPPVAIPSFLKPHLKEIAQLICVAEDSIPPIPGPLTSKEISTNEAALIHLRQKEKCLDTLLLRYEREKQEWIAAKRSIQDNIPPTLNFSFDTEQFSKYSTSQMSEKPVEREKFTKAVSEVHNTIQNISIFLERVKDYSAQTTKTLEQYNYQNHASTNPKTLIEKLTRMPNNE